MSPTNSQKPKREDYVQCPGCTDLIPRRRLVKPEPSVFEDEPAPTPTCPFCGTEVKD